MQSSTAKAIALSKSTEAVQAMEKGDAGRAAALCRGASDTTPRDGALAYALSQALNKAGNTTEEKVVLEQAVGMDLKWISALPIYLCAYHRDLR